MSKKLLTVFLLIPLVAVLTLSGCTSKKESEETTIKEKESTVKENEETTVVKSNYKLSDRQSFQTIQDNYFEYVVDPSGDVYVRELNSTKKRDFGSNDELSDEILKALEEKFDTHYFDNSSHRFFEDGEWTDHFVGLKLNISGVLTAYGPYRSGNAGNEYVFFIQEGGKVAYVCSQIRNSIDAFVTPKVMEGLENVVTICENDGGDAGTPYGVCADGTEVSLHSYMK